jgi:threonine synthase
MDYYSTRDRQSPPQAFGIDHALSAGLAADGGLYVPARLPQFALEACAEDASLAEVAQLALVPFFARSSLHALLPEICQQALNITMPVHALPALNAGVLELFHGPSAAFKDFAARFLARCLQHLRRDQPPATVLVATSGDTGGAVAAAFHGLPHFRVVILYPAGRVSARQAHQLSAYGDNVETYYVQGSFDDCQALVKAAFSDQSLRREFDLLSANSISLGRLLPQMAYFVYAARRFVQAHAEPANFIVPSGNLGHGLGAILARACGAPINRIVLACNANTALSDYFAGGTFTPQASVATLANAMDVGAPSNFERLQWLYPEQRPTNVRCMSVSDRQIAEQIRLSFAEYGYALCPHTACAMQALTTLRAQGDSAPYWLAATADPAKFETIVEPLIKATLPVPQGLAALLAKPARAQPMAADLRALSAVLRGQAHG